MARSVKKFKVSENLVLKSVDPLQVVVDRKPVRERDDIITSSRRITLDSSILPDDYDVETHEFEGTLTLEGVFRPKEV